MATYIREDQFAIHAGVNGVAPFPDPQTWQTKEGGDLEADSVETHPGSMLGSVALGGPAKRTDATIKRMYSAELHPYVQQLEAVVGNARMWISWTPLDANKQQNGETITITGVLKTVTVPNIDANAAAAALLTLVMSCDQ